MAFPLLVLAVLPGALASVPSFEINLDLPPRERYRDVHKFFREEGLAMIRSTRKTLNKAFTQEEQAQWTEIGLAAAGEEGKEELEGILEALNSSEASMDVIVMQNMLYEMSSPTLCSGLLAAGSDGKVIHGRNMDYRLEFKMPDGEIENWPNVTYEAIHLKGGQRLFMSISWALYTGVHTGMRYGGWTFEQNTRPGNNATTNLAAAKKGGIPFGWKVRHLLETVPDFDTALRELNATLFMAPQYFILAGSGPFQGAVVSMDRMGAQSLPNTPPIRRLGQGAWYVLQTNDDVNKLPNDPRRPATVWTLSWHTGDDASVPFVREMMLGPTLHDYLTVFTWVAVPSTNYTELHLPGYGELVANATQQLVETPSNSDEVILTQKFLAKSLRSAQHGSGGRRLVHVASEEGIRLVSEVEDAARVGGRS